jgi:hypothetical protein
VVLSSNTIGIFKSRTDSAHPQAPRCFLFSGKNTNHILPTGGTFWSSERPCVPHSEQIVHRREVCRRWHTGQHARSNIGPNDLALMTSPSHGWPELTRKIFVALFGHQWQILANGDKVHDLAFETGDSRAP